MAGSKNVIELHGTAKEFACSRCFREADNSKVIETIKNGDIPKCEYCGGIMKPKVVLYEEPLYEGVPERAIEYISKADMLIVGGTSLLVYPAASFVRYFMGKYIVIINNSQTGYDDKADLVVKENIGEFLDKSMTEMGWK